MEIRDATPVEYEEVSRLLATAYREYMPNEDPIPEPWASYAAEVADVWSRLEHSTLVVCTEAGRMTGTVTFYPDGSVDVTGKREQGWPKGYAAFRLLGVLPEDRGSGYGRALTEECIRRSRDLGATALGLHTTEYMAVGKAMYERMGWERYPDLDFRPGPSIVVMAYRLLL